MGRTDYIVQAGIGFDLDRSSARKSIGLFEGIANTLNTVSAKAATEQFADNEKQYQDSMKVIQDTNKKADEDLRKGVKASAKATQAALESTRMKPPAEMAATLKGDDLKAYETNFKRTMAGMTGSYSKFAKEAAALGIKVSEAEGGWGTGDTVEEFSSKDIETRNRIIKLTERMVKDEKARLAIMDDTTEEYQIQLKEVEALEHQLVDQRNLNDDITQQEKKNQKVRRQSAKDERKAENQKIRRQKEIVNGLKNVQRHTQRLGQIMSMTAGKIGAGLKNAFVIGTAAATAFFYKMQPLAESVQEFERTIINANSVFNVTKKELFEVSDTMVRFTLKYGVAADEMAEGLYQLASAGLSAAESQEVLQHTMKLAMATQGDHNALAKLTVQTIMGFGMEMEDSGLLVDKFAHSIQKSLIEWDDLASSVKFAMPFFVATGQSVDELLGGLEVLTNRALEAGIAGRGLRQALAQFAKHAGDNESAMRKLGIEIMDTEGNMRALHEIALDASAAFGDVTDLEALTIMLEDMNVRGATAFALLVQNADEFEEAVGDISNAAGSATAMADIQQQSLANQIQLVKNALLAPFLFADEVGEANDTLNEFTWRIQQLVTQFTQFFIVTLPDGTQALTEHSKQMKDFVINALAQAVEIIERMKEVFLDTGEGLETFTGLLDLAVKPLHMIMDIIDYLGPQSLEWAVKLKVLNSVLPVTNVLTMLGTFLQMNYMASLIGTAGATATLSWKNWKLAASTMGAAAGANTGYFSWMMYRIGLWETQVGTTALTTSNMGLAVSFGIILSLMTLAVATTGTLSDVLLGLAIAVTLVAAANAIREVSKIPYVGWLLAPIAAATIVGAMITARDAMQGMMGFGATGGMPTPRAPMTPSADVFYDSGGVFMGNRMYDTGGPTTEHGMAILQKGETIIPKTRNMLDGGLTLNIGGDIVTSDAEDFADRIAAVLPEALRRQSDIGGI